MKKGEKLTEEQRERFRSYWDSKKGKPSWNKGKKLTKEHKEKLSKSHMGQRRKHTELTKRKISSALKGNNNMKSGNNHHNWRGGIRTTGYPYKFYYMKKLVKSTYDNKCQICGKPGLDVHHIDYDKNNNNLDNLILLCRSCHSKTGFNRKRWINYFKSKKCILITGSSGMIASELINILKKNNKNSIFRFADLKSGIDLTHKNICEELCKGVDEIYSLVGIKGSPTMTKKRPVDFMIPILLSDTNLISCAQECGVKKFLYTSSIAVENPESDKYPAWAKKTAEYLIEAMRIQYPKGTKYCVVRPANVYGIEDLDRDNLMVVSSLIKQTLEFDQLLLDEKGLEQTRDIIHARDVARGMIKAMEEMPENPVNLCSGKGVKIRTIVNAILKSSPKEIKLDIRDLNLTLGPRKKVMKNPYIKPEVKLEDGIKEIIDWHTKKR